MPEEAVSQNVITEENILEVVGVREVISEDRKGNEARRTRLTGIIQKCNQFNSNMRRYPSAVMEDALDAISDNIKRRRVLGELDHASDAKIHLDRISHVITKVWMEGDNVFGELEVLEDMPCGKILKTLIESDITVGISSRGVGDLQPVMTESMAEGYDVQPGYRFVTWDVVAEPSVMEAELSVMESLQRENKKWSHKREEDLVREFSRILRSKS